MSRETENVVLLLVGTAAAMILFTGTYTRYVKPSLLPWLAATAVLLVVLAVTAIIRDIRHQPVESAEADGHSHHSSIVWLLVIPVALLIFLAPPALTASSVASRTVDVSTNVERRPYPPLPDGRAPELSLPEVLVRAAKDSTGSLDNRLITVTGFTLREGESVDLARIVIICCAADGRLARIRLGGPGAAEAAALPEDTWLRVEGKLAPVPQNASPKPTPTLVVSKVTQIEPPGNAYVY